MSLPDTLPFPQRVQFHFRALSKDILAVTLTLFKIMIPALILIHLLEELGAIERLSTLLAPAMSWVGLPEAVGIVWATTMLTNLYTGILVLVTLPDLSLTTAQVTVLGCMMLVAHGLPIEARIAQKAGVRLWATLVLRIGGALLFGGMLSLGYHMTGTLQEPFALLWQPEAISTARPDWLTWAGQQLKALLGIFGIICALISTLRLLRILRIEQAISWCLAPFLRLLGIGREAVTITLIGLTLGLSFGGGLLIREAQAGHVGKDDVFCSMGLLALCHSIIEDTLLILLIGGHLSGIFWGRMLFALVVILLISRLLRRLPSAFKFRWLYTPSATPPGNPH